MLLSMFQVEDSRHQKTIDSFPIDILHHILKYLTTIDLFNLSASNNFFHSLIFNSNFALFTHFDCPIDQAIVQPEFVAILHQFRKSIVHISLPTAVFCLDSFPQLTFSLILMENLTYLDLSDIPAMASHLHCIQNLKKLDHLKLSDCAISCCLPLSICQKLNYLSLSMNPIKPADLVKTVCYLKELVVLDVIRIKFTLSHILDMVINISSLTNVCLSLDDNVTFDDFKALVQVHNEVKIDTVGEPSYSYLV